MLFDSSPSDFESEKERNLYYKFFAGYYFNELIPGYQQRLETFCDILNHPTMWAKSASRVPLRLAPDSTHVSFDNHLYLFEGLARDRGEFADILLHDPSKRLMVLVEAKLHSNWSYDKDIVANGERHQRLRDHFSEMTIIPVLLVTEFRWNRAIDKKSSEHSNYLRFERASDCQFRVILWEQLLSGIEQEDVKTFLNSQLHRYKRGVSYVRVNDWFVQQPPKATTA